ncbi:hypothetical protein [Novosphingobium pentaromativorans]|uniref:Chorismate lyase n=1 Tax=Novosphingobium pentaromativorans US6-1 TaxID=1088721 RepID=G6E8X6_9SPHN|nr:hypothetical protein [Novosphingobium pentaromativorans]EHJ62200.1 hypothetical protein NSU_0797 [Novosphingobium pentaromativorans US6-1]
MASRATLTILLLWLPLTGCAGGRLAEFERALAAQDSATSALQDWCTARDIGDPPRITARPVLDDDAPLPSDALDLLQVEDEASLGYRHVRLDCGGVTLSQAHNWFVPARLTPEMNAALRDTDQPFGKVIAPLRFTRERLAAFRGRVEGCPPGTVLSHRAVLHLPGGAPISLVVECYQSAALAASVDTGSR